MEAESYKWWKAKAKELARLVDLGLDQESEGSCWFCGRYDEDECLPSCKNDEINDLIDKIQRAV